MDTATPLHLHIFRLRHLSGTGGFRVLIARDKHLLASADFYQQGSKLRFFHSVSGPALDQQVIAVNAAEEQFRNVKGTHELRFIDFFLSSKPHLEVSTADQNMAIYAFEDQGLKRLTGRQLTNHFSKLIKSKKPISSPL
ncbi:hypothetical protein PQ469_16230 [Mucilaginibacter sp. KACC 22773]|uniref:hypothetical protein n=1 Tax=Mucilaginibacter sp. KACC 22773 TaxID=3025671 RepID=UPI0023659BB5|nr:hypothetical protein [Mucilaginibacter sp. KACC 22773]WDF75438.1 hypothetical protein PQ469_16230 [Mucilaginibacter sp. KACC 22773]